MVYVEGTAVPQHVAIIMDGNGRWAKSRGLPRTAGHRQGVEAVRRTISGAIELGIQYVTLFSFSSENWGRPVDEVSDLMGLMRRYLRSETAELREQGVRVRVIGERDRLPRDIAEMISQLEVQTRENDRLNLVVALSYGGRAELVLAAKQLASAVQDGKLSLEEVSEETFGRCLMTDGIPDPDLLIRTSGEKRISNFLLWQLAYSELIFVDTLWPDFGKDELEGAIAEFRQRDRRYGVAV